MGNTNSSLQSFCKIAIILLALFCHTNVLNAQTGQGLKDKEITLKISNQPLGKVLEKAAEAAGAKITMQDVSLWNISKPTSIVVKNKPLDKVLDELIGDQDVKIRYEGDQIIIEPQEQKETTNVEFKKIANLTVTGRLHFHYSK